MGELFDMSVLLHSFLVLVLLANAIYHLAIIWTQKSLKDIEQRIYSLVPFNHFLLSVIFFTGLISFASIEFSFSWYVSFMIIAWVLFLVSGIRAYRLFKNRATDEQKFVKFVKIKYSLEILIIAIFYAFKVL